MAKGDDERPPVGGSQVELRTWDVFSDFGDAADVHPDRSVQHLPFAAVCQTQPMWRPFRQVDVFGETPHLGNPLAVVLEATGVDAEEMQRFARWTNLSETTFVLPATAPTANYAVRIFGPGGELPFAGHPTLGTAHAWLSWRGVHEPLVIQQCAAGLVPIRWSGSYLSFAAPPLIRSGPADEHLTRHLASILGVRRADVVEAEWVDNGPGWVAVMLSNAEAVLALRPGEVDLRVGVIGAHPTGSRFAYEVRAFVPRNGVTAEDPVTGSLNASLAQWMIATGRNRAPYVVRQGTVLGRAGVIHIDQSNDGSVWVGGATHTSIHGEVAL
jgi:PhzF family phenazine biosynthesis protein